MPEGFAKNLRLNRADEFKTVLKTGRKYAGRYFVVFSKSNNLERPRLGLIVSKKALRHATERNQVKRIIRESFRLNQAQLAQLDIVVMIYAEVSKLNRVELRQMVNQFWVKLI